MRDISQRLRRLLYLVPFVAQNPDGVSVDKLASELNIDRDALMADLDMVAQVGPPDGDPGEYLVEGCGRCASGFAGSLCQDAECRDHPCGGGNGINWCR